MPSTTYCGYYTAMSTKFFKKVVASVAHLMPMAEFLQTNYAFQEYASASELSVAGVFSSHRNYDIDAEGAHVPDIGALYLKETSRSLWGIKRQADSAMEQLNDEQFFAVLDVESNSVAIIVKHVVGNMRSRFTDFLTTDGEKPDRNRDQEFIIAANSSRAELMRIWEQHWQLVFDTVQGLGPSDLAREVMIRREPHTVLQAINRQVVHYALHVGQIIFLAKHWKGSDWKTLSVARGQSEAVNAAYAAKFTSK